MQIFFEKNASEVRFFAEAAAKNALSADIFRKNEGKRRSFLIEKRPAPGRNGTPLLIMKV